MWTGELSAEKNYQLDPIYVTNIVFFLFVATPERVQGYVFIWTIINNHYMELPGVVPRVTKVVVGDKFSEEWVEMVEAGVQKKKDKKQT